jgi:hypothetical protein
VTRSKALLIVVGNPAVLGLDPLWRRFLNYVYRGGGWTGSSGPTWDPEDEADEEVLAERLGELAAGHVEDQEPDEVGWAADD